MYIASIKKLSLLRLCGRFSQSHGWNHSGHTQPRNNLFVYIEDGECTFKLNGQEYTLKKNRAIVIPKNTHYIPHTQSECKYAYFHFDADIQISALDTRSRGRKYRYCERIEEAEMQIFIPEIIEISSIAKTKLNNVLNEMLSCDKESKLRMNMNFLESLTLISEQCGQEKGSNLAEKMRRHILENLTSDITLGDLQKQFCYTKQHLIRTFKDAFGTTPTNFIIDTRLEKSVMMLAEGNMSVKEIAFLCGFNDTNYYSRTFKRRYGISPTEYRDKESGGV